jgi:hypothetical protein
MGVPALGHQTGKADLAPAVGVNGIHPQHRRPVVEIPAGKIFARIQAATEGEAGMPRVSFDRKQRIESLFCITGKANRLRFPPAGALGGVLWEMPRKGRRGWSAAWP